MGRRARSRVLRGGFGAFEEPRMELRVLVFAGWRSSSEVLVFRGEYDLRAVFSRRCARRLASRRSRDCYVEAERSWPERLSAGEALRVDSLGERGDGPCLALIAERS